MNDSIPMRSSKASRWRALVLILVHVLAALHIAHWLETGESLSPLEPSEAMEISKTGAINAGLIFFGLLVLSTLVLGRWFCGWACHLVALQDGSLWLLKKVGIRPKPLESRLLRFVPMGAALYMFVWPWVERYRLGIGTPHLEVELTKADFWSTFPPLPVALLTFFVCGFLIIYFLGAKGFCTYACPYGAVFGVVDRVAPGRIRVTDACEGCGHCTATCTSNVVVHQEVRDYGMVVDPGCMKCMDCVSVCPKDALYFGLGKPALGAQPRREDAKPRTRSRRPLLEEVFLGLLFLGALFALRGLYGSVPFLLAVGAAIILAFLVATCLRLFRRPSLSAFGGTLKSNGSLTGRGRVYVFGVGVAFLFTVHSGFIRYHETRTEALFEELSLLRGILLDDHRDELPPEAQGVGERGLEHARAVQRFGLLSSVQNDVYLAWFALLVGEDDTFEEAMIRAAASPRATANLHYDLGRFYAARERRDEAIGEYEVFLELEPRAVVFDQLARLRHQSGDVEGAVDTFEAALEVFPDNADLHYNFAFLLELNHRIEEAYRHFQRVVEIEPRRAEALDHLLSLGRGLKTYDDMGGYALELCHLLPPAEVAPKARIMTEAWRRAGRADDAREAARELLAEGRIDEALVAELEEMLNR